MKQFINKKNRKRLIAGAAAILFPVKDTQKEEGQTSEK